MKKHEHTPAPKQDFPTSMVSAPGGGETLDTPEQPPESEYKGDYRNLRDGFLYKHCVWPHPLGKTHKAIVPRQVGKPNDDGTENLIHTGLFWEGTEEEFFAQFRKE